MQQSFEDQTRNTRRAWLRWVVASMTGGVVSSVIAFATSDYFIRKVIQPQPGLDIAGAFGSLGALIVCTFIGGLAGGFVHWQIVGRSRMAIDLASLMTKWAFICVCLLAGAFIIFVIFPFFNDVLDRIPVDVGAYGVVTLVGAVLGPVVAAVTGYTRPRRGNRTPEGRHE